MKKILLLCVIVPYFTSAFIPAGGNDYFILEEKNYHLIFDKQYLNSIEQINQKIKKQIDSMSKFKKRTLDETLNIILFSPKSQISNAFATILPFYTIGMFPTGILSFEYISESSWLDDVFEHELNHIFQLSHSNLSPVWRKIFKFPILIIPLHFFKAITPYPNMFLPRFILEGDAVLKESLKKGGRLYDGAARAFVYSQIRHYQHQIDKLKLTFSINNPHMGQEIYLHGGYLMAMMAEKYSQDTIHSFFTPNKKKPSQEEIKKFKEEKIGQKLSPAFGKIFSFRYLSPFMKDIKKSYVNYYLSSASKQNYSTTPVLFESSMCRPFNQFKDEIFFLTSDFKSTSTLRVFNKKSNKWTHQKIDLPLGKVFKINNQFYSRSSEYTAPNTIHYSLFSKGLKSNKAFDSKYVTDIKEDKTLFIDTKNNIDGFKLYLNDTLYADVHSSALLDHNGNVYYFKQKGSKRILYKNKSPLFSYKGYYGKLLEIDSRGIIYFLGASRYGSSIYQYRSGKISRVSSSDTVIQAQKINNKEFIVCEVTPYKYEYKIAPQIIKNEQPVFYKYKFKQNKSSLAKNNKNTPSDRHLASQQSKSTQKIQPDKFSQNSKQKKLNYQPYSSLRKLRFAGGLLAGGFLGNISTLAGGVVFSDYLMHNFIQLIGLGSFYHWGLGDKFTLENPLNFFNLNYLNKTYRLNWDLGYSFLTSSGFTDTSFNTGYLSLRYPLFREGRWSSSFFSTHSIEKIEKSYATLFAATKGNKASESLSAPPKESRTMYQSRGNFYIGYSQSFPFNYFLSNKSAEMQFFLDHKYKQNNNLWNGLKGGIIGETRLHIGRDFYWTSSASYASSLNADINPVTVNAYSKTYPKGFDKKENPSINANIVTDDTTMYSVVLGDITKILLKRLYSAKSIGTAGMGIKKMFSLSSYNLFTASFHSRYLFFEKLSHSKRANPQFPEGDVIKPANPALDAIANSDNLMADSERQYFSEYTHWLEWTFGLEYIQLLNVDLGGIIIGGSFGFRTPLKFWKAWQNSSDSGDYSENSYTITTTTDLPPETPSTKITNKRSKQVSAGSIGSSLNFMDPSFQLYIKVPF